MKDILHLLHFLKLIKLALLFHLASLDQFKTIVYIFWNWLNWHFYFIQHHLISLRQLSEGKSLMKFYLYVRMRIGIMTFLAKTQHKKGNMVLHKVMFDFNVELLIRLYKGNLWWDNPCITRTIRYKRNKNQTIGFIQLCLVKEINFWSNF